MQGDSAATEEQENARILQSWKILAQNNTFIGFKEEVEKAWRGPFFFIQGADCQFGLIERYLEKKSNPGWSKEIALAELAVSKVNAIQPRPAFFVICGDLCDAFPGEDPETYRKQVLTFKKVFQRVAPDIPLVCVCGNHDVGDNPTPETIKMYRSNFGDDYYSFWCHGILFLVLNSQYWVGGEGVPSEAGLHTDWLRQELEKAKSRKARIVAFQHIPFFQEHVDEVLKKTYFTIGSTIGKPILDQLVDAGVETVFCGHLHRNAGGSYRGMEVVVTSAIGAQLGKDKSGLRIVKVTESKITHEYFPLENVPSAVKLDE